MAKLKKQSTLEDEISSGYVDLTKTGPLSYRQLQGLNRSLPEESYENSLVPDDVGVIETLQRAGQINYTGTPSDFGQSIYDQDLVEANEFENYQDYRAERQPWYAKIGAGLAKGAILAGTTFLDGTIGLLVGGVEAINRRDWSGLWDNDFSRAMQAVNEWSEEEALPNYYTQEEQNSPWYENIFTANFIGDKFIKNLGFSIGALYSGGITSAGLKVTKLPQLIGAITKSTKAPAAISTLIGAATSAVNEGRIEALNNSKDWQNLKIQELDDNWREILDAKYAPDIEFLNREYQSALEEYEATKGKQLRKIGEGMIIDPAAQKYQAKIAALDAKRAAIQNRMDTEWNNRNSDKTYIEVLGKIEEDRLKMGNTDILLNLPILTASNIVQFTKFYANGFNTARRAGVKTTSDAAEETAKYAGKSFSKGKAALKVTQGALSEGTEEILQKAASLVAGNYYSTDVNNFYKSQIDQDAEKETLSWIKAFASGINETVNDGSSWEEFFIGALTGLIGIPSFRSMRDADGNLRSPITLQGGAINEIRDYRESIARSEEIANYLNQRVQSPEFLNYYRGMIRHNKYQNDMNNAVEENDEFNFKNAEHAQFVSDIIMFDNAGRLEDLRTYIESSYDISDENLQAIIENTTATDENGKKIGPFIDSNGNPMYATEEGKQQMIEKLTQTKDNMISTLNNYRNTKNDLDVMTGGSLSNEQLAEMTWLKTQVDDWAKRANDMAPLVKSALVDLSNNLESTLASSLKGVSMEGAEVKGIGADRIQQLKQLATMDNKRLSAVLTSPKNEKFVERLVEDISTFGSDIISALDKQNVIRLLQDLPKIGKGIETYNNKLEEYLADPSKIATSQAEATEAVRRDIQERKSQDIRTRLSSATTLEEFKTALNQEDNRELNNSIVDELISEGNQIAKDYKETLQYNHELMNALNQLGETNQITQDALALWQGQANNARNLGEIANPNSIAINEEEAFLEDSAGDAELARSRFENARYALQRAMSKVNNGIRFKDRFSEEYKKPVDEPISPDRGVDKDATGDSGTPTVPYVNPDSAPVETPFVPVGNVTAETVIEENRDANDRVETPRVLDQRQQGQRKYYRPAIPELHIEASKEGDFRPFDVVVSEREPGADFAEIYNYLRDNGAFNYVNSGKLKVGDTIKFMIDPEFEASVNGKPWHTAPTIFLVTRRGQVVGSIDEGSSITRYEGLENLVNVVRDEFSKREGDTADRFFATPQVKVSKIMVGRIPFISEERSLADIPGVIDGDAKPVLGIIKNGTLTTNEKIDDRLIIKPVDMAQKEGRLYLLIPNAAGTYSPAAVRVKHFNTQEFNLDDSTVAATPIGSSINDALNKLASAASQDDISIAMKELAKDLYMQDIMITWFDAEAGSGIVIGRKLRKPDGTYEMVTINGREQIKEEKTTIYYQSRKSEVEIAGVPYTYEAVKELEGDLSAFIQPKDTADIRRDILGTILRFNLPLQVSTSRINESGYNNRVIKSNILTSNLREAKVIGSWFTTDYFDNQNNLQTAISPASVIPAPSRKIASPVGGTEGVMQGTRVVISETPYMVDLKSSIAINEKTGERRAFTTFNSQPLIDMAWAQETFGDATESSVMTENKVITPRGDVLDRSTGHYIVGKEAQRIKDKIAGVDRKASTDAVKSSLPIFSSSLEGLNPENRTLPENAFEEGGEIGYYEKDGKLYTGYLKKIGEVEVTHDNGQKEMIPIHVTKVRDRGFGRAGELGATSEYLTVFPNGKAISTKTNDTNDNHAAELIMRAMSAKPGKVLELSSEKTQIYNPEELQNTYVEPEAEQYTEDSEGLKEFKALLPNTNTSPEFQAKALEAVRYLATELSKNGSLKGVFNRTDAYDWQKEDYAMDMVGDLFDPSIAPESWQREIPGYKELSELFKRIGINDTIRKAIAHEALNILIDEEESSSREGGAQGSIQKTDSINPHDDEFEDDLLLREASSVRPILWDREKELTWLRKVLPQLSEQDRIKIVEGLIQVAKNGPVAWGMFSDGIVTLSDIAAEGTVYHEAFHVVFNTILTESEKASLYEEAKQRFGNKSLLELEEDMAEGFREYVTSQESRGLGRKILDFFKNLFAKVTNWKYMKPSLNAYYQMINQGRYRSSNLEFQKRYTPEMEAIRTEAIANGTFMTYKGNPTNLTERQWLQVRTKAFKDWFGDWENNPSEASKVVDENGEPLVVYHESPNQFTEFDTTRKVLNVHSRSAVWFSTEDRGGRGYGKYIYPSFLNIRRLGESYWDMEDTPESLRSKENRVLEDGNFDGAKLVTIDKFGEETQYVVYNSNQVKSAVSNIGSFSTVYNDIRYRTVPNSSWSAIDNETKASLEAKGWTKRGFDSISQAERDQAIKCVTL